MKSTGAGTTTAGTGLTGAVAMVEIEGCTCSDFEMSDDTCINEFMSPRDGHMGPGATAVTATS